MFQDSPHISNYKLRYACEKVRKEFLGEINGYLKETEIIYQPSIPKKPDRNKQELKPPHEKPKRYPHVTFNIQPRKSIQKNLRKQVNSRNELEVPNTEPQVDFMVNAINDILIQNDRIVQQKL